MRVSDFLGYGRCFIALLEGDQFMVRYGVEKGVPKRVSTPFPEGVATKVVKEAANTLLTAASTGNLGATLATGAGRTVVNEQGQDATTLTGDGTVLLLDAPADLEVFVTRAM